MSNGGNRFLQGILTWERWERTFGIRKEFKMSLEIDNVSQSHEDTVQFTLDEVGPIAKFFSLWVNKVVGIIVSINRTSLTYGLYGSVSIGKQGIVSNGGKHLVYLFACECMKDLRTELVSMIINILKATAFAIIHQLQIIAVTNRVKRINFFCRL